MSLPPRRDLPTPKHPLKHLPLRSLVAPTSAGTPRRMHGCVICWYGLPCYGVEALYRFPGSAALYLPTAMPLRFALGASIIPLSGRMN